MGKFDLKAILRVNTIFLRGLGLWPDNTYSSEPLYAAYCIISTLALTGLHNTTRVINLFFIYHDLGALADTVYMLLSELVALLKSYYMFINMPKIKKLMAMLDRDSFQPKTVHQKTIMEEYINSWYRFYKIFTLFGGVTVISWAVTPIVNGSYRNRVLPFPAWLPYDFAKSPIYQLTYIYQLVAMYFLAWTNLNVDLFLTSLMMYIAASCAVLCDDLRNLVEFTMKQLQTRGKFPLNLSNDEEFKQELHKNLIDCIKHHQEILDFAKTTNEIIKIVMFWQFITTCISLCVALFHLTLLTPLDTQFYAVVSYECAVLVQIYIISWFGNDVIMTSGNIPNAAFECDWSVASTAFKKDLIFLIRKAQKPIVLNAVDFFGLSLETFMRILRTSYSYFALLRQVNSETKH